MTPWFKGASELLPLILILTITAGLVYLSLYPDLPKIERINEAPRQTGGQGYSEPPLSNPQVTIIPPPTPEINGTPSSAAQKVASGILNTAAMAVFVILGGLGIYFLLKYRSLAKHVLAFALGFATLVAAAFFAEKALMQVKAVSGFLYEPWYRALMLGGLSIPLGVLVAISVGSNMGEKKRKAALAVFCSFASALIAVVIPTFSILPLILFMAAYDLYAVRHGSIKKIAKYQDGLSLMVVYEADRWSLGFGDLIFYSLLASSSLAYTMIYISRYAFYDASRLVGVLIPWIVFALVAAAILIGFRKSLERKYERLSPGLPIPILAGCGVLGLSILALQIVNYLGWGWFVPIF